MPKKLVLMLGLLSCQLHKSKPIPVPTPTQTAAWDDLENDSCKLDELLVMRDLATLPEKERFDARYISCDGTCDAVLALLKGRDKAEVILTPVVLRVSKKDFEYYQNLKR